ncbi:hypothetical protein Naga_100303g7 [Nannochloropsis gaditana]|uniref:Uncharacterized protein n=1 Tax=Nannochloropsis gaditana TaxID=72520 RepID=W7T426_9STRA|nr:hypothetical protein Naga_100303g7 [Nannochloropsis gaditana]
MGKAYQSLSASWQFLAALVLFLLAHGNCDARAPAQDLGGETDALNLVNHLALRRRLVTASEVLSEGQGYNPNLDNQSYYEPLPPSSQEQYQQRAQHRSSTEAHSDDENAINLRSGGVRM